MMMMMSMSDFAIINKLGGCSHFKKSVGTGSFSEVHRVRRISDNREYALKKVRCMIHEVSL
jgi:serine/threonine protein kinase